MPLPARLTYAEINALLPDNTSGDVSVGDVRNVVDNLAPYLGRFAMFDDGGVHTGSIDPDGAWKLIGTLGWTSIPFTLLNQQTIPAPDLIVDGAGWYIDVNEIPGLWDVRGFAKIGVDPGFAGTIELGVNISGPSSVPPAPTGLTPEPTAGVLQYVGAADLVNPGIARFACCVPSGAAGGPTTRFEPSIRTNPGPGGPAIALRLYDFAFTARYIPLTRDLALP